MSGQNVPDRGIPYLDIYMPDQYHKAGKVWDIQSNDQNLLFLASDKGLLEFDGQIWKKYKGSKGFTRSLLIVSDSLIYTGSDLDFGKWELNSFMDFEYTSLYPFKENIGQITEEFWGVHQIMDFIIFVSFNNVYVYKNEQLTKISAPSRFSGSYFTGESLYLVDEKFGLYKFDGVSLSLEFSYPKNNPMSIVGIDKDDESLLIITQNRGLYKFEEGDLNIWSNELSEHLARDQAFCFTKINDYYVFGTILNGIYITDPNGKIIQHINKQRGLPNNTILDLYYGPNGTLWVSMDLGITGIQLSQDLAYVFDHAGNFGTGQTALIDKEIFYLGTNQGLYFSHWNKFTNGIEGTSFRLLPESAGQVWDLAKVNNDLLCGHDKGLFSFTQDKFHLINDITGILDILKIDNRRILVGTYNGIHLYEKNDNSWSFIHELELIKGACSQIVFDDDQRLWVLIPNYGVIKAELNEYYNVKSRIIYPIEEFTGELLYLKDHEGKIEIITESQRYIFDSSLQEMKEADLIYSTDLVKHQLPKNYLPTKLNDTFEFFPVYNGFALKHLQNESKNLANDTLLLRSLLIYNVDTSFAYSFENAIPYSYNNLKVNCIIPHKEHVTYRYYIEGYMEKWSDWKSETEIEILNIKEGEYTLQVEGRFDKEEVQKASFQISIEAPWYRSIYAYFCYLSFLILLVYSLFKWQKYVLEEQKQRLLYKEKVSLRMQAEEFKKESIVKRQDELEKEKELIEKELRSTKIQLVIKAKEDEDKKRVIESLTEKLRNMQGNESGNRMKWKELFRILDSHQERENNTFQIHMDELNQAFTQKLKNTYPSLTMYDLRLCTYIKTGLSTREIAEMMHVLPSSINVSRSRLRKKLKLNAKDDLFSFLEALN